MKYIKSNLIKVLILFSTIVLIVSIFRDIDSVIISIREMNKTANYIAFETKNILDKRKSINDRIETSIAFKSEPIRKRYSRFKNLNGKSLEEVEQDILTLYPEIGTLDSIPFHNDDIATARKIYIKTKNKDIQTFYQNLLFIPVLEALATAVYDDSGDGLSKFELIRPITEDSTYIGSQAGIHGFLKPSFRINGIYFEDNFLNLYTIPKRDTFSILTYEIRNRSTYIDTIVNEQTIIRTKDGWKNKIAD